MHSRRRPPHDYSYEESDGADGCRCGWALRTLEILHLAPLQAAAGAKLNKARGEMNRVQKALEVVPEKAPKGVTPVKEAAPAASLIDEIQNLVAESKQAEIDKEQAEEELTKLSMFKNLDPATAAALQAKGIYVKLYQPMSNCTSSMTVKSRSNSRAKVQSKNSVRMKTASM